MLTRRNCLLFLICSAALVVATLPALAATITYTDPNAWAGATSNKTVITFTGLAGPGNFADYSTPTGQLISGADFVGELTSNTYQLKAMDQYYVSPYWNWGMPATLTSPTYNLPANPAFVPYVQVNLPADITAFSVYLATISPSNLSYQVNLSDGEVFTVGTYSRPTMSFFGLTADNPITYADFTVLGTGVYSSTYGLMANFQLGSAAERSRPVNPAQVPEAGTFLLIGSGLIGFRILRRYRMNLLA